MIPEGHSNEQWKSYMNGDIEVKVLNEGPGDITADMTTVVTFDLKQYFFGETVPFESVNGVQVKIGDSDVVPAVELALRHSKVGDVLRIISHSKFAYGSEG